MATAKRRGRAAVCGCLVLMLAVTAMAYQLEYVGPTRRIIGAFHQSAVLRVTQTVPKDPPEFVHDIGVLETTSHIIRDPERLHALRLIVEELKPSMQFTNHRLIGRYSSVPSHKSVSVEMLDMSGQPLRKIVVMIAAGQDGCLLLDASAPGYVFETPDRMLYYLLSRPRS